MYTLRVPNTNNNVDLVYSTVKVMSLHSNTDETENHW